MGGSLDMTGTTSWWGACAAQKTLFPRGEGLPVAVRRTRDSDRRGQILALRSSLPNVRHDHSSLLVWIHHRPGRPSSSILFCRTNPRRTAAADREVARAVPGAVPGRDGAAGRGRRRARAHIAGAPWRSCHRLARKENVIAKRVLSGGFRCGAAESGGGGDSGSRRRQWRRTWRAAGSAAGVLAIRAGNRRHTRAPRRPRS